MSFHNMRELVAAEIISPPHVRLEENIAIMHKKPVGIDTHNNLTTIVLK